MAPDLRGRPASVGAVRAALRLRARERVRFGSKRFFKTAPGEYASHDRWIGVTVPDIRAVVREYAPRASIPVSLGLLRSPVHEDRLCGLLILGFLFARAAKMSDARGMAAAARAYLSQLDRVDNWDLVDASAYQIAGEHVRIERKGIRPLLALSKSRSVWRRRIAIVATFAFLCAGSAAETFAVSEALLDDPEDLVQKAVGWMLREAGARVSKRELCDFLDSRAARMPRTMLRYSLERLEPGLRRRYMAAGVRRPPARQKKGFSSRAASKPLTL